MKYNFTPESDKERAFFEDFIETKCLQDVNVTVRAFSYGTNEGLTKVLVESNGTGALKYLYAYKEYPKLCFRDEYGVIKGYNTTYEGMPVEVVQPVEPVIEEFKDTTVSTETSESVETTEKSSDTVESVSEDSSSSDQLADTAKEVVTEETKTTTKRGRKKKTTTSK